MNIKLAEVGEHILGLQLISGKKLPVKLSYAIAVNLKILLSKEEDVKKQREKILQEYCVKDDKGQPVLEEIVEKDKNGEVIKKAESEKNYKYVFNGDDETKTIEAINELYMLEEDLSIRKVKYEDLERCDSDNYDNLTGKDIEALLFMIED